MSSALGLRGVAVRGSVNQGVIVTGDHNTVARVGHIDRSVKT
jgi:hypothetical protein